MDNIPVNIHWEVDVCRLQEVDRNWRTENFAPSSRIVPFSRIYYPVEGEGYIEHSGRNYHLRKGFFYLVPPFVPTKVECPSRLLMYWANFNAHIMDSELDIFSVTRPCYKLEVSDGEDSVYRRLFEHMTKYFSMPVRSGIKLPPLAEMEAVAALTLLVCPFLNSVNDKEKENIVMPGRFFKLLYYIEQHLGHNFSLKELAKQFSLNPVYLSNIFAREMGLPLIKYCNKRRINRAITLLSNTDYTISEIAYQLGAGNSASFSRLFKRHHGVTPIEFRRTLKKPVVRRKPIRPTKKRKY
jgi:AraC-like DNA-binding protein